jgi:histidinol dehydrogenase
VTDFQKIISLAAGNASAIEALGEATIRIAQAEGLDGHAASIQRRLKG